MSLDELRREVLLRLTQLDEGNIKEYEARNLINTAFHNFKVKFQMILDDITDD